MIMCKGDIRLGSGCGKCVRCMPDVREYSLFEDWYICHCGIHPADFEETFRLDDKGEYYHGQVFWMHKAFLAGQVLREEEE